MYSVQFRLTDEKTDKIEGDGIKNNFIPIPIVGCDEVGLGKIAL